MRHVIFAIALLLAAVAASAARIDTLSIATERLASPESVTVVQPDVAAERQCPVVYLLNGFSDNHLSWLRTRPDLPQLADAYGFIFVMPDGRDSWYWDSPVDPKMQMESFIVEELVPFIDSRYNTIADPSRRAITGLSMGGQGAMWLAMRHPDVWANVGSTSGGLDIRPFPDSWKMKLRLGTQAENPQAWEEHTPINLVKTLKPGQLNIIFDCGTDDFFCDVNNAMHAEMLAAGIPHDYISRPGGHTHPYWANSILHHLLFFNEQFKK